MKLPCVMKLVCVACCAAMVVRDDRVGRTESAERFAEREMKIQRPTGVLVIARGPDRIQPLVRTGRIAPERNRWVTGVARRRHVVLGKKISHCITSLTVSTNSLTLSSGVPGKTPWPRPQIQP